LPSPKAEPEAVRLPQPPPVVCAVVAAAGQGARFGRPKQLIELAGKPLAAWSLELFARATEVAWVVVTCDPRQRSAFEHLASDILGPKLHAVVEGGPRRQDSVYAALRAIRVPADIVVIHDGARPFAGRSLLRAVIAKACENGAAIAAVPVTDTIKQATESGSVLATVPRERLWAAQTPQAFALGTLLEAHRKAEREGYLATDDAELVERLGTTNVAIVAASYDNLKITTPQDVVIAERIAAGHRAKTAPGEG
jgi:2-C-methyl-D-erythritol 4-phosphate cytidylyltransferase